MEKLQKLGEDNLDELYCILDKCNKQLALQDRGVQDPGTRLLLKSNQLFIT